MFVGLRAALRQRATLLEDFWVVLRQNTTNTLPVCVHTYTSVLPEFLFALGEGAWWALLRDWTVLLRVCECNA